MKTHLPGPARMIGLAGLFPLLALSAEDRAWSQTADVAVRYQVVVRQVDGHESVPAHMTCTENKLCRGLMSIAVPSGHLRVLVTAVIDRGNVYIGFRTEELDLSCSRGQDFMHLVLEPPPTSAHAYAVACDSRRPLEGSVQGEAEAPSSPQAIPRLLAVMRIEVRSVEGGR